MKIGREVVTRQNNFWENKKVMITGANGFIGSWAVIWALEAGAQVIGVSRTRKKKQSNYALCGLESKIIAEYGDITDKDFLREICDRNQPEVILHLAGQAIEAEAAANVKNTYESNVLGTLNILECVREYESVKACAFVTTAKCYNNNQAWDSVYTKSKGCANILIDLFRDKYFGVDSLKQKAVVNFILCNIIGGGDFGKGRLIPECIHALMDEEQIQLKTPEAKAYWASIFEVTEGIYRSIESELANAEKGTAGLYELKNKKYLSVREITGVLEQVFGETQDSTKTDNAMQKHAVDDKLSEDSIDIGFAGEVSVEDMMRYSLEWYQNCSEDNLFEMCCRQLRDGIRQLRSEE